MGLLHSPSIVTNGLVLSCDAANEKSYNRGINLLRSSSNLAAIWALNATVSRTVNAGTAPDQTNTAVRFDTASGSAGVYQYIAVAANQTYTYSIYLKYISGEPLVRFGSDGGVLSSSIKANTSSGVFSVDAGSPSNIASTNVGNGWYRFSFSLTPTSTGIIAVIIYSNGTPPSSFLAWGPQVEKGSIVTTYVPTTSYPTAWNDLSGNSNNFTLVNDPVLSYNNEGVFTFDGTNDFANVPNNSFTRFPHNEPWSFSIFCKPITQNLTFPGFIILGNSGASGILIYYTAAGIYWKHNAFDSFITSRDLNVIKNITLTYAGSGNVVAYVNGVFVQNLPTMVSTDSVNDFIVGRGDELGNVDIYNFYKYNRQLSASEVSQNFNALRGRFGL